MSLLQKFKKLTRMSADEIQVRLGEWSWKLYEKWRYGRPDPAGPKTPGPPQFERLAVEWLAGISPTALRELASVDPRLAAEVAADLNRRCDQLLEGRWRSLGHDFDFRGPVDWHRDLRSGYQFPRRYHGDVPHYGLDRGGDAKLAWEPGRHQFLFELAAGWAISGDEQRATLAARLWLDWIEQNPYCIGIHWTSALEIAMRIVVWQWSLAMLADWPGWGPQDLARIHQSVVEHAHYLSHHLSFYSSPYNHLVGEATALFLAGCWLRGDTGRAFRQQGARVLLQHTTRQFCGDAYTVEQASGYHFYTLGFLTLAREASRYRGDELAPLDPLLARAWKTAALLQQPDGEWARYGDIDSARAFPVLPENEWDFRGLLSLGAVCAREPLAALAARRPGAELFWVRGLAGVRDFQSLIPTTPPSLPAALLPHAGYAVIRSGNAPGDWVLFDCGPIAAGLFPDGTPSTAHGHADLLQVLVHHDGQPVLIDSGMDGYAGEASRVEWFRGPEAHNTLEVAGAPMARHAGRLAWSHVRHAERLQGVLGESLALACGAYVPAPGLRIERHLCVVPGVGVWMADRIQLSAPQVIRWYWQPQTHGQAGDLRCLTDGLTFHWGNHTLKMQGPGTDWKAVQHVSQPQSPAGWKCPGYGQSAPGTTLEASCLAPAGGFTCLTGLVWRATQVTVRFPGDSPPPGWCSPELTRALPHAAQWQVQNKHELWQIVTGCPTPPAGLGWQRLGGSGDWPCWRRSVEGQTD